MRRHLDVLGRAALLAQDDDGHLHLGPRALHCLAALLLQADLLGNLRRENTYVKRLSPRKHIYIYIYIYINK